MVKKLFSLSYIKQNGVSLQKDTPPYLPIADAPFSNAKQHWFIHITV